MRIDYKRRIVDEALSEEGTGFIQLVNKSTVGLSESIKEAISNMFVTGQENEVASQFKGVVKSMLENMKRDGIARSLGGYLRIYPVVKGPIDLDTGWNPAVNSVAIKAQLMNEVTIDITDWSLNDVTEGKVSFSLDSVTDGTTTGVVTSGVATAINGKNLPAHADLRLYVVCGDKAFEVASTAFTNDVSRVDIPAAALSQLASATYSGKEITFTLKGCYNSATISGVFYYNGPKTVEVTKICPASEDSSKFWVKPEAATAVQGVNLDVVESVSGANDIYPQGEDIPLASCTVTGTKITIPWSVMSKFGTSSVVDVTFKSHGGVPGSTEQVITKTCTISDTEPA